MSTAAAPPALRSRRWVRVLVVVAAVLVALVLLVVLFPWDLLRGPVNRYVSEKTGRHFAITRHLDVEIGRTTRVVMDGVEFANPDWAQDRYLVKADAAEVAVRLLPLLLRREIILPSVHLTRPQLGLQIEADGRRTWALGSDTSDEKSVPAIGALVVDEGSARYLARHDGADIRVQFAIDPQQRGSQSGTGAAMPLKFQAQGRWRDQPFRADGRTGDVLYLSAPLQQPFPAEVQATTGDTQLRASGTVASLASLDGANVDFRLQGPNLAELYRLAGVTLPDTPRYAVAGRLSKEGSAWRVRGIDARLGDTDMAGELVFDRSGPRPLLTGKLASRVLDFEDLAPVIGLDEGKGAAAAQPKRKQASAQAKPSAGGAARDEGQGARQDPARKVLPTAALDVSRLKSMNADVRVDAAKVVNAKRLPLDRMGVHVRLRDGVLVLDPLDLGVAGGRLAGTLRIDANAQPVAVQTRLDARSLELGRLLPRSKAASESFGKIQGQLDLSARGASVARLLADADGHVALLMGKGQISNILLEFAGLDGGEIMKFLVEGDNRVALRCAATAFDVQDGLMISRALVLDTDDTVFHGGGTVNLASESMDLVIRPYPKDTSILSVRSPLHIAGSFGSPDIGLDKGALAGRAGLAIALGAINPLLALAATIETGPGHDADCAATLRDAAAPRAQARLGKGAPAPSGADAAAADTARRMGAAPAARAGKGRAGGDAAPSARTPAQAADSGGEGRPGKPVAP